MKKLFTYDIFVYEGVRDKMTPKSREEVEKAMTNLKSGGMVNIYQEIIGKVISEIEEKETSVYFIFNDGSEYAMYNEEEGTGNDCQITLEDVVGEWDDLIGQPLLVAEEIINSTSSGHGTWTFYHFATIKGYVDLRWYGESNGYYSEAVTFRKMR